MFEKKQVIIANGQDIASDRGTNGVNFSRTFPFMEASGGRFGTAALSPHVSLAQFASNNCAEVLLTVSDHRLFEDILR